MRGVGCILVKVADAVKLTAADEERTQGVNLNEEQKELLLLVL